MQTRQYRDFDAFAEDVRDVDAAMMLQNPKRHSWTISHLELAGLHVQHGQLGSGNIVEGQSWSSGYLLYLPLSDDCEYVGNGATFGKGSFWVLEPGAEFCISTKDQHDWCTILLPGDLLRRDQANSPRRATPPTCWFSRPNFRAAKAFEDLVHDAMLAATTDSAFEDSTAAGVSERTLRNAFNEYFGVGPSRYLQLRRLRAVRRALRAADPEQESVTGVLVRHGEWEFSRFARRYRQLFGELPSETLLGT